jgi:hypothetical protein
MPPFANNYFLFFSQTTSKGLAKNIELYVPIKIPIDKAKIKSRIDDPPKNKIESNTNKVVAEVLIERMIV